MPFANFNFSLVRYISHLFNIAMFDILVYLFENYFDSGSYPDSATLTHKLTMAGFANEDITETLNWLSELTQQSKDHYPAGFTESTSFRCYSDEEIEKIDTEGRGFIFFLEHNGIINPLQRELLIDRLLVMDENSPSIEKIKLIVLTELWIQNQFSDHAVLEKLLFVSDSHYRH